MFGFLLSVPFLAFFAALVALLSVRRARVHGALLSAWGVMTLLGFVPGGVISATTFLDAGVGVGGVLIAFASMSGIVASGFMLVRLACLHRGEALGNPSYLVGHHAAVVLVFFLAELMRGDGFGFTVFCLVACSIGALITSYDKSKLPAAWRGHSPQPVAF